MNRTFLYSLRISLVLAVLLLCVHAQTSPGKSTSAATPSFKPISFGGVRFSGSLRVRPEVWDWFDTQAAEPNYSYLASMLRFGLSQEREKFDWQVEFEH